MLLMLVVLLAFIWGFIAAFIAIDKNRSGVGWFFAGLCLGVIGVLIVFVAFPLPQPQPQPQLRPQDYAVPSIWWK